MSADATSLGAAPAATGQPPRWFHHPLQAPPQALPDNLHGILCGGSRGRLRALALALRAPAGPVLVLAADDAAQGPPPGIPIRDLDLRDGHAGCPLQQPAFRRLCERAAGDLAALVASCWCRIADQDIMPGCYRALTLRAGPRAVAPAQLTAWLERRRLPAPIARPGGLLCLLRRLAELRGAESQGWLPGGEATARLAPHPLRGEERDRERTLALAFAAAREVHVPAITVSLTAALADADPVHGPIAAGRIAAALHGARRWRPWADAVSVITASADDADRLALVLDGALAEAQARLRQGDAAVRTLVIDSDLLVAAAQESGQAIARSGRRVNCSCLVLADAPTVPGWRDHAGFTITDDAQRLWLAIDQDYRIAVDGILPHEVIVSAHAQLHPNRQGG